jgi:predicted unusual protein kinase regulating ubiquinone biosynthesis (AarF/ABC1/UbiB family)
MRDDMLSLRGPAMKLGQMLSMSSGVIPEEAMTELTSLQMEAPGMHPSLVRAQFKGSMGKYPEEIFRAFDPEPFASASLGQVHHATTREGERVAVKIQYPGIGDAIKSDIGMLRGLLSPARATGHIPNVVVDEIEKQIAAETDYVREADNAERLGKALQPLEWVEVPRIYRKYSTDRVLTMSVVEGDRLDRFLARRPSRKVRDLIGARLVELFYFQVLTVGSFHADPHWGNYLFRPDGSIGLIDFGCVKDLTPAFVDHLKEIFLFPGDRRGPEFRELLRKRYAIFGQKLTPGTAKAFMNAAENFYRKVYPPETDRDDEPFDFSDPAFFKAFTGETRTIITSKGILPEYVFYGRAEIGLYHTLHRLGARVPMSGIVRKMLSSP